MDWAFKAPQYLQGLSLESTASWETTCIWLMSRSFFTQPDTTFVSTALMRRINTSCRAKKTPKRSPASQYPRPRSIWQCVKRPNTPCALSMTSTLKRRRRHSQIKTSGALTTNPRSSWVHASAQSRKVSSLSLCLVSQTGNCCSGTGRSSRSWLRLASASPGCHSPLTKKVGMWTQTTSSRWATTLLTQRLLWSLVLTLIVSFKLKVRAANMSS